jgi:hypothetical protein
VNKLVLILLKRLTGFDAMGGAEAEIIRPFQGILYKQMKNKYQEGGMHNMQDVKIIHPMFESSS